MKQVFQCLLRCRSSTHSRPSVLLAASGPLIHSFNIKDGSYLSTWPTYDAEGKPLTLEGSAACTGDFETEDADRPLKRRKTSLSREVSSSASAEILVENPDETEASKELHVSNSDVTKIISTSNNEYVIAVTGEDKTIRLFQLLELGSLRQISERHVFDASSSP